ncbi:uncharacterized protein LOC121731605 [Aricia agestis]|uniref:uncharacterized protein LOC121731605 n=1 Tax=Aricia agestis TaxID=91739 RepID=UPI001C204AA7|nr:uncharacterized protein LOC121731605 [Aricia agestis]
MLSKRDKFLVQPWEQRRFNDHRSKVASALPAIDDCVPPARPHVALKLKKLRKELDRKAKIESDNFFLLQRLHAIMKVNRLDNHWTKPLPNFQQHKVGQFFNVETLNRKLMIRSTNTSPDDSYYNTTNKCYACEYKKMIHNRIGEPDALPPLRLKLK